MSVAKSRHEWSYDGRAKHPLYNLHCSMLYRCENHKASGYKRYGGRGIKVCERWSNPKDGFWNFVDDIGERPEGCSLDRINNDGNYEPSNCKWSTRKEQQNNMRDRSLNSNSATGVKGISYHTVRKYYTVRIKEEDGRKHIGTTKTLKEAKDILNTYKKKECK